MAVSNAHSDNLGQTGQNLIRILIASYFIGVSIGLIDGTSAGMLAATFLPPKQAELVGATLVFMLAYLVMMGMWLRPAALLLGLLTFWSSYVVNFGAKGPMMIGEFWRDLTLIGALMLTYVQSGPRAIRRRQMVSWKPKARRIMPKAAVSPRRVTVVQKSNVVRLAVADEISKATDAADNIFVEEFDEVMVS